MKTTYNKIKKMYGEERDVTFVLYNTLDFPEKFNVIDSNNVVLGYCLTQRCCEDVGWVISHEEDGSRPVYDSDKIQECEIILVDYVFDKNYIKEIKQKSQWDDTVVFKLVSKKGDDLFILIYNYQNGHYDHGFSFSNELELAVDGTI